MGQSLLFKWEDSQALKHHCGFCERPLNHPGARVSCFGKHSEPCARFHQAMFMRLRGHTCQYCLSIDEAHYKRHQDIAEQLRALYESCSEVDWNIVPSEPDTALRGRRREFDRNADSSVEVEHRVIGDTLSSKRERKEAKRLARAASRPRVITQEEIRYVDSVIHSADGITSNDTDGPRNAEELDEIERQLRYHAHIYNTRRSRDGLKKLADVPSDTSDVDFDAEMDRILDVFRIIELLKRNTNTRGLQGKELRKFLTLVDGFKRAVVEDIVLVKKDTAEVRMRRAGYLRYIHRTSYDILEDRYSDKNWKTGEKITPGASSSSSFEMIVEELDPLPSDEQENQSSTPPWVQDGPDRRHLETTHPRVHDENGIQEATSESYENTPSHLPPDPAPSRGPVSLRVVNTKILERPTGPTSSSKKEKATQLTTDGWNVVTNGSSPRVHVPKLRVWGNIPVQQSRVTPTPRHIDTPESLDQSSAINTSSIGSPEMAPAVKDLPINTTKEPESFVAEQEGIANAHPIVSQKKKSKKLREAKRKVKKTSDPEESTGVLIADDGSDGQHSRATNAPLGDAVLGLETENQISDMEDDEVAPLSQEDDPNGEASTAATPNKEYVGASVISPPSPAPTTSHGKQIHWMNFVRHFTVDQLTNPFLPLWSGCTYASWCAFEKNGVPDCPFHQPHCACADPTADQCYLVMPSDEPCSTGPYNRLRGEKLLAQYEEDDRTKGRLMLVDNDMVEYLVEGQSSRAMCYDLGLVPPRLAKEYAEFADGFEPGSLMEQERRFERLKCRNALMKQQLTYKTLREIQCGKIEREGAQYFCYCRTTVPQELTPSLLKDLVACSYRDCPMRYFHKSCIKKLGVDKASRWYCTSCEKEMRIQANRMLRKLGYTDISDDSSCDHSHASGFDELRGLADEKVDHLLRLPKKILTELASHKLRNQMKDSEELTAMP